MKNKAEQIWNKFQKSRKQLSEILHILGMLELNNEKILNEDNENYVRLRCILDQLDSDIIYAEDFWANIQVQLGDK